MPGVEEVAGVVVGDSEGEESRAPPGHVRWKGKFLNILPRILATRNINPLVRKKRPADRNALRLLTLNSLHKGLTTILIPG